MQNINIIGVPEHFNFPWIKTVAAQPLESDGFHLTWKDESKGSGAMNKALRNGEADIAILLTESFIKDKAAGNPGKIIGYHVLSPLTWGIHVPAKSIVQKVQDLKDQPFLISRFGSGSHLMAFLLARQNQWDLSQLTFKEVGNMDGALEAFQDHQPQAFLWEKFTTKPLVDQGLFRRVGEIPTPWPCFVIVAHENLLSKHPQAVKKMQRHLYQQSVQLKGMADLPQQLSQAYGLQETDLQEWIRQTEWAISPDIQRKTLENTIDTLVELELLGKAISVEELVHPDFARLV